jgi:peptidoglycan hydrolase-like protein with peptidoglycan-binding domain
MKIAITETQVIRLKNKLKNRSINEDILNDLISKGKDLANVYFSGQEVPVEKKISDNPSKANFVSADVDKFFDILKTIDETIEQQKYGKMVHQQKVEAVQIGLQLLGYELKQFGTDGLFGSETASAVKKFKKDNNIVETINERLVTIGDTSYSYLTVDNDISQDQVNKNLLDDLDRAGEMADVKIRITTASSDHGSRTSTGNVSRHGYGAAVDIASLNGVGANNPKFNGYGNLVKDALVNLGYVLNSESGNPKSILWQTNIGGNHFNHIHVSNKEGISDSPVNTKIGNETITPGMVKVLITKLEAKNITNSDLEKFVDMPITSGGSADFTDLDLNNESEFELYKKICDNFIGKRDPNAKVNGAMMAESAKKAFNNHGKYVPPELALAQLTLEGGIGSAENSVPMRTKNPFNIGNTGKKFNVLASFETGVDLYYDLIARRYLGKGKTASDLVNDFRNKAGNRYAESTTYEEGLKDLINQIRRDNTSLYQAMNENINMRGLLLLEADKRQAIKNTLGFSDDWANEFHNLSDKLSIWIASTFLNELMAQYRNRLPEGEDIKRNIITGLNQGGPRATSDWASNYKDKYEYIMHWIRAPRREQLNIRELTFGQAYSQAEEWHESLQTKKDSDYQETGDVFIDYRNSDGVGYYWVNLHKPHCSQEQERMGHCARTNSGELISFRRINDFGEGESYLTVDYRPGGVVGDFHRHGNKKPTNRFHRQIVDFLINTIYPVSSLTKVGVHKYEDNFKLSDLSAIELEKVYENNSSLRFDINNEDSWPEIIKMILLGEINFDQYSSPIKLKLLKKSKSLNKQTELSSKFSDEIIKTMLNDASSLNDSEKSTMIEFFGSKLNQILIDIFESKYDSAKPTNALDFFKEMLRFISQKMFDNYQVFCDFIDNGVKKFDEATKIDIISTKGIKKLLFTCTDEIPFLKRYIDNTPVDQNGNISVKSEDGLWGLVKTTGEIILHPQFSAIAPNPIDRGKTYMIKNLRGEFFKLNPSDMTFIKIEKKR